MIRTWTGWLAALLMLAAMPASASYQLQSYGFGSGGAANSTSSSYALNGITGTVAGDTSSSSYKLGAGETRAKQADVPGVAISNDTGRRYNKLLVNLTPVSTDPSTALYAFAISTNNFTTTQYIEPDDTVGSSFSISNFLSYAAWGGATGFYVIGLTPSTTYEIKATAYRGKFTQSPFSAVTGTSTASTVSPQLSFQINIDTPANGDLTSSPPYAVNFNSLTAGSINRSPDDMWMNYDTNAESGGGVYVSGQYGGLHSAHANYLIPSETGDLTGCATTASGLQVVAADITQTSGGPLTALSPYNGTGNQVGIANNTIREIFNTTDPVTSGEAAFDMLACISAITPAASDYTEVLTAIAAGAF